MRDSLVVCERGVNNKILLTDLECMQCLLLGRFRPCGNAL